MHSRTMASSRWKRFGFFDRHALSIPSEVLEDLLPFGDVGSNQHTSGRRSPRDITTDSSPTERLATADDLSLVVSTAALPFKSKPSAIKDNARRGNEMADASSSSAKQEELDALSKMWSTLRACSAPDIPSSGSAIDGREPQSETIQLPSQSQSLKENEVGTSLEEEALDGLVLVFLASQSTGFIHCFDVTVRCNPPDSKENLEDLDGWRGYFAPFSRSLSENARPGRGLESPESHDTESSLGGIVAVAACRTTTNHKTLHLAIISQHQVCVWEDPHLHLSCRRPLTDPKPTDGTRYLLNAWNAAKDGVASAVDVAPGIVAVGTDIGAVLIFIYGATTGRSSGQGKYALHLYLRIPPPPASGINVVSVKLSAGRDNERKVSVFVAYRRTQDFQTVSTAGICCYDVPAPGPHSTSATAPLARHDLDGRHVSSPGLCDAVFTAEGVSLTVARPDGLYTYSETQKIGVAPIDGTKLAMCLVPPPIPMTKARDLSFGDVGSSYALVASTDTKSDRDAVDIYDSTNKLVAFHLLLSPGHHAVKCYGVAAAPTRAADGRLKGGRSSAIVLTSGGSLITLTEKVTAEKVALLVQKNLFSAAIVIAYADPSYESSDITALYRKHAEHLYRKGDYSAAIEQYIHTIGSLESSHVIFRFLDAPKIPLLTKYLEELRARELATPVHNELLRTCYLKLNDSESADSVAAGTSSSMDTNSLSSLLADLSTQPKDALATICSLEAPQAAEALIAHGPSLARVMPRETAGVVVSLCVGTYSPSALAEAASSAASEANKMLEVAVDDRERSCDPYPVRMFYSAFLDNPKMLRLILAHCNRNKCPLTPSLRRTLLELTLAEWNQAKRAGDTEGEKLRHREAIAALTDSHSHEIGDYDALVIVESAGFDEGELLLYERLQMGPMLLARYAQEGSEKSRRQMLAMCEKDPEILADVLGHFVSIASERLKTRSAEKSDEDSEDGTNEILEDIEEALAIARLQGQIPPVRIARILAGEGTQQFSPDSPAESGKSQGEQTVPLSVALEYVGAILDESRKEITRLKSEVEEYNQLCNSMDSEVASLLRASFNPGSSEVLSTESNRMDIDEMYSKVRASMDSDDRTVERAERSREAFWRELNQSEDTYETIARFFAKGVIY